MTLKPEVQKEIIKIFLETGNLSECVRRTGISHATCKKYALPARAEVESRPAKHQGVKIVEEAREAALSDLQISVDYLRGVVKNPLSQIIGVKAAEVLARVASVKADITGEKAPVKIDKNERRLTINLTKEFREYMDGVDNSE